jgi:DNA (cytosine-5)-methyltransferase 1
MKNKTYKLGELFCGPGGIAVGAFNAGVQHNSVDYSIEHAWANDYDKDTCNTFRKNFCHGDDSTVICEDVRTLDLNKLAGISPIDGLAFGFPCNDFSTVGEQKGFDGKFGPLYTYGVKALELFQPEWFLAENVGGLKSSNEGKAFQKILKDLYDAGYNLTTHLYKFNEYGIPQARQRIIIIGIRKDLQKVFKVPSPTNKLKTCKQAIESPRIHEGVTEHIFTKQSEKVKWRLKFTPPGENAWKLDEVLQMNDKDLMNYLKTRLPWFDDEIKPLGAADAIRDKISYCKLNVKSARMSQIYKRLDPTKPSYTITGSGGGGTHVYHWDEHRALTNRERARLQTFPDNHVFCGSKESVRKQIGMAVPPDGVKVIFDAILKTMVGIEYENIQPSYGYLTDYSALDDKNKNTPQMFLFEK